MKTKVEESSTVKQKSLQPPIAQVRANICICFMHAHAHTHLLIYLLTYLCALCNIIGI
jgi:hypothetical protein